MAGEETLTDVQRLVWSPARPWETLISRFDIRVPAARPWPLFKILGSRRLVVPSTRRWRRAVAAEKGRGGWRADRAAPPRSWVPAPLETRPALVRSGPHRVGGPTFHPTGAASLGVEWTAPAPPGRRRTRVEPREGGPGPNRRRRRGPAGAGLGAKASLGGRPTKANPGHPPASPALRSSLDRIHPCQGHVLCFSQGPR